MNYAGVSAAVGVGYVGYVAPSVVVIGYEFGTGGAIDCHYVALQVLLVAVDIPYVLCISAVAILHTNRRAGSIVEEYHYVIAPFLFHELYTVVVVGVSHAVYCLASTHSIGIIGEGHVSDARYLVRVSLEIGYSLSAIHYRSAAGVVAYDLAIVGNESVAVGRGSVNVVIFRKICAVYAQNYVAGIVVFVAAALACYIIFFIYRLSEARPLGEPDESGSPFSHSLD